MTNEVVPAKSLLSRIADRLAGRHSPDVENATKEPATVVPQPAVDASEAVADGDAPGVDPAVAEDEVAKANKNTEKSVPVSVLQERVAREVGKTKKVQATLREREVALAKAHEGFRLLNEQYIRVREAWANGQPFDDRDDRMALMELKSTADKNYKRLDEEQLAAFQKADAEEAIAAAAEQHTENFAVQIGRALKSFPLAEHDEIVFALKKEMQRASEDHDYRPATAHAVAKRLHEKRDAYARQRYAPAPAPGPQRPVPVTTRPPSGGSRQPPLTRQQAILERLQTGRLAGD